MFKNTPSNQETKISTSSSFFVKKNEFNESELYFKDVLYLWYQNNKIRLKTSTLNKYQNLIETHIAPSLGDLKLSEMNATVINGFLFDKLNNGRIKNSGKLSASYVRSIMLVISAALKLATLEEWCAPIKSPIFKPIVEKKEINVLSVKDQKRLESTLLSEFDPIDMGIYISLHTGMRIGEICALKWSDVEFEKRVIHVRYTISRIKNENNEQGQRTKLIISSPKTRASSRDVPIHSALFFALDNLYKKSFSEFVISSNEKFTSPRTLTYRFNRLIKQHEIPPLNFHALRHTFATRCVEVGVDVKTLSDILGHSNINITLNTYVHSSMELKRYQMEKMAQLFE